MNIEQYLVFVAITGVFLLSPGPSVLLSINNGAKYGVKLSAIGVLGNVVAFQVLIILSALGLGAIITASGEVFNVLKVLGAIYLIYLGVKVWLAPVSNLSNGKETTKDTVTPFILFKQAFFVTSSNPKALVYVSALLPQFINTEQALLPQVATLALTSAVVQFIIFMSYAALASRAREFLKNSKNRKIFNRFSGVTFIGFGVSLGLSENRIE